MRTQISRCVALFFLPALGFSASAHPLARAEHPAAQDRSEPIALYENRGQWPAEIAFQGRRGPATAWFHERGLALELVQGEPIPLEELAEGGASGGPRCRDTGRVTLHLEARHVGAKRPSGLERLPGVRHFLSGPVESHARDAASFGRVVFEDLYPGIDWIFGTREDSLAYEFHLDAGAPCAEISLRLSGAEELRLAADGSLEVLTAEGLLVQSAPRSFERDRDGAWIAVPSRFVLHGAEAFGFEVERIDPDRELLIDPVFHWATFVGGGGAENLFESVSLGGSLEAVVGVSNSPSLPAPWNSGANAGSWDALVVVVDTAPGGAGAIWSALLGGSNREIAYSVAFDETTRLLTVGGMTESPDFGLLVNASSGYESNHQGNWDGFVLQFDPRSGVPSYATYLGYRGVDRIVSVRSTNGILTLGGYTRSGGFPMATGATPFQATLSGGFDQVILKLDPTANGAAQLVASTFLGSTLDEGFFNDNGTQWIGNWDAHQLHVEANGDVWVGSSTSWTNFPTSPNAFDATLNGSHDATLTKLDSTLSQLLYSTYLGGSGEDSTWGMHVEVPGTVTLDLISWGPNFPVTAGALQSTHSGVRNDGVVCRLDLSQPPAAQLRYSSYFGGNDWVEPGGLSVEPSSAIVFLTGGTMATNLPTTVGAYQTSLPGAYSGFAARLELANNPAKDLHYLSYFGDPTGTELQWLWNHRLRPDGRLVALGAANGSGFPVTPGAPQTTQGNPGNNVGVIAVMDLLPTGAERLDVLSGGCSAHLQLSSAPRPGNASFELLGEGLPPQTPALVAFGIPLPSGIPVGPCATFLMQFPPQALLSGASADARGLLRLPLPIPPGLSLPAPGVGVAVQLYYPILQGPVLEIGSSDALVF